MPDEQPPDERVVRFFAKHLRFTKGSEFAGRPFDLLPWQEGPTRAIFGTLDEKGLRVIREVYVEVAKKNGKTEWGAGLALSLFFLDDEPGAEIYLAATTRDQASNIFRVCESMIRRNPLLLDQVGIVPSSKLIYSKEDPGTFIKAISADAGTQDGVNPHAVIFDEVHRHKTRDLWDVLSHGMATRSQPLMFAITTAGVMNESELCWGLHERARQQLSGLTRDPTFYPVIHTADEQDDWTDEKTWLKANPSLEGNPRGFMPMASIRQTFERAQKSPAEENSFRRFRLSQWVAQESRWLPMEDWDACGRPFNPEVLDGRECYAGLDLSSTLDVTALVLAFEITAGELGEPLLTDTVLEILLPFFWLPSKGIQTRKPAAIAGWAKKGLIETTEGTEIDYDAILRKLQDLSDVYNIRELAHDRWGATKLIQAAEAKFSFPCVPISQRYQGMSAPSKEFEGRVIGHKIRHNGNPVLRWMADCVSVKQDPMGNIMPVKPDRRKHTARIDGIVAAVMATDRLSRHQAVAPAGAGSVSFA